MLKKLVFTLIFVFLGLLFTFYLPFREIAYSEWYMLIISSVLALGLYGSVYGIDTNILRLDWTTILSAITIGVFLKIIIIGSILYLITGNSISFLFATIVAQIDPLSVAAINNKNNVVSSKARTILGAWSSFDDPMTVIISLYVASIVLNRVGQTDTPIIFSESIYSFLFNILFAVSIYFLNSFINKYKDFLQIIILIFCLVVAVKFNLMLGIAIIGLFVRPNIEPIIDKLVTFALYISSFMLGILLLDGVNWVLGILVGIFAVLSQVIVSSLLVRRYSRKDKWYLAAAQQNGVTAIVLALLFEPVFGDIFHPTFGNLGSIVATIAPAILTINIVYVVTNYLIENYIFPNNKVIGYVIPKGNITRGSNITRGIVIRDEGFFGNIFFKEKKNKVFISLKDGATEEVHVGKKRINGKLVRVKNNKNINIDNNVFLFNSNTNFISTFFNILIPKKIDS